MEWAPIPDYQGFYEASRGGDIRRVGGRILKGTPSKGGYLRVNLSKNGIIKRHSVHVLVLSAHVGPRPPGMFGCHGPSGVQDNNISNLRWDTPKANSHDRDTQGQNWNSSKTRCPQGHEYTVANTRWVRTPNGPNTGRQCRKCDRDRNLQKRSANRAAYNAAARERRRAKKCPTTPSV